MSSVDVVVGVVVGVAGVGTIVVIFVKLLFVVFALVVSGEVV